MAPYVYSSMFPTGFLPSELHRNCGRSQEKRTLQKKPCHQFIGGRWPSILAGTRQRLRRDRLGEPERSVSGERLSQEAEAAGPGRTPSVGSDGRRQGRKGSEGQRTALISAFFSSDQQAIRLTRRPEATRSRPEEPEANLCRPPVAGVAAEVRSPETERQQP